jgi:integrase
MASIFKRGAKWRVQIRRANHPTLTETFNSKADAQRWAREQEVQLDQNVRPSAVRHLTFAELVEAYVAGVGEEKLKPTRRNTIKRLKEHLGHLRIEEINKREVINFMQRRERDGAGPVTLTTDFTYLSTVLRYGGAMVDAEKETAIALMQVRSAKDVLKYANRVGSARRRDRRPTEAELLLLRDEFAKHVKMKPPMWDIVLFAICSCMRLGEIVKIRWDDLDLQSKMVVVRDRKDPKAKIGNDDRVPLLNGPVIIEGSVCDPLEIILRQSRISDKIFPFLENKVSFYFTSAVKNKNIGDLHFHDLRHDGISRLFEAGYEIQEVSMVSGHKTWEHLKRYTNLRPETLHR